MLFFFLYLFKLFFGVWPFARSTRQTDRRRDGRTDELTNSSRNRAENRDVFFLLFVINYLNGIQFIYQFILLKNIIYNLFAFARSKKKSYENRTGKIFVIFFFRRVATRDNEEDRRLKANVYGGR